MIGNDIVDLALAKRESNWRRAGFLAKIFTAHEQHLIDAATDPDQMVWLLWSMKESAYKLAIRRTQNRAFAPIKLACCLYELTNTTCTGTVDYGENCHTKSVFTPDYISTISTATGSYSLLTEAAIAFADATYQTQHQVMREHIKKRASALFAVPEQAIYIQKDRVGIPELWVTKSARLPLSISHHGHFGAYVIGNDRMEFVARRVY